MTLLVEEPWPWFVLAGVGQMLCVALVAAGQRRAAIWASVAIFAVAGLGLLVERWVVTQREEIEQFLDRVAAAATADNLKQLVDAVDPAAVPLRQEAVQAFSQFKINEFVYNRRRIAVVDGAVEPTATADVDLTVMVARRRRGVYQESEKVSIDARLTLGKLKEQWCVRMLDVKSIITAERNIGGP